MNDLDDDAKWDLLHVLLFIWLWRNEPELATCKRRPGDIYLDNDLKTQLASYVN